MKTLLALTMILYTAPVFANTSSFHVKCSGVNEKGSVKIEVKTNEDASKLLVTKYPANQGPSRFDVSEYDVINSVAMIPFSSIEAASDQRPVDGALNEANLVISTVVSNPSQELPAKLTLTSTSFDRLNGKEVSFSTTYTASCQISRIR